jgi:hypothetical protein
MLCYGEGNTGMEQGQGGSIYRGRALMGVERREDRGVRWGDIADVAPTCISFPVL